MNATRFNNFEGMLLGTAVGDAIGLPREGLSGRRAVRMLGGPPLRHQLIFGRGMVSDDTEHACMTAQALLASGGDPHRFVRSLAWRLRWWLLGLPAGVGLATAKGILRLWIGVPPAQSGVWSAGNGPAMRAGMIGVWCAGNISAPLAELVRASTRMTHTDPVAEQGALVIAVAARLAAEQGDGSLAAHDTKMALLAVVDDEQLRRSLELAIEIATAGGEIVELEKALNLKGRATGWMTHTVPVSVYCWLRYGRDYQIAIEKAVSLGGDTDTIAAIAGGLIGATFGADAIPLRWIEGLIEWPRSTRWMRELARRLAQARAQDGGVDANVSPLPLFWPGQLARNVCFLAVVLLHGVRRMLPPY